MRVTFTLALGSTSWYGWTIFVCELVGCTAVLPYCAMLVRRCKYSGTGLGLPTDDGRWKLPDDKRFVLHVLVPCYKVRSRLCDVCVCVCA